jgi:cardiolipin synthase
MNRSEQENTLRRQVKPKGARRPYRGIPRRLRRSFPGAGGRRKPKGTPTPWARFRRFLWSWWLWAVLAGACAAMDRWGLASISGILAILAHVVEPKEFPPRYGLDHEFPVESDEFLSSIAGATGVPFSEGNRLDILNNGDEFYPVMQDAIREAKHSITMEAFIYWAGDVGRKFAEALADKARAGVKVKVLLDAIGSSNIGEEILRTLESGGCQIAWFNPISWYTLGRFNNRTHRKSMIIDGRIAFTGGAGIADHWRGRAQDPEHWRDLQIRVEGAGVQPLQSGFAQNWLATTGELVSGFEYYPGGEPVGRVDVQTILSSPQTGSSAVRIMYYFSIVCARKLIYIANPYFVPDQAALDTLADARKRNVDVKIMVSGIHNDSRLARRNSTRLYGRLLRCGVEIYEYNRTMLHHKIMIVDGAWATVGTANFDDRSFAHNEESNVCFFDPGTLEKLRNTFLADLDACDRITFEQWKRRGLWVKAQELFASFLREQV